MKKTPQKINLIGTIKLPLNIIQFNQNGNRLVSKT